MDDNLHNRFSNRFINFWMGWWIPFYGIPILLKVIYGIHYFGIYGFLQAIWVINTGRIFIRNFKIYPLKLIILLAIYVVFTIVLDEISDNLYYGHIAMQQPELVVIRKYNIYRSINVFTMVVIPMFIFIMTKIYLYNQSKVEDHQTLNN